LPNSKPSCEPRHCEPSRHSGTRLDTAIGASGRHRPDRSHVHSPPSREQETALRFDGEAGILTFERRKEVVRHVDAEPGQRADMPLAGVEKSSVRHHVDVRGIGFAEYRLRSGPVTRDTRLASVWRSVYCNAGITPAICYMARVWEMSRLANQAPGDATARFKVHQRQRLRGCQRARKRPESLHISLMTPKCYSGISIEPGAMSRSAVVSILPCDRHGGRGFLCSTTTQQDAAKAAC
jgi:hypothetical protein